MRGLRLYVRPIEATDHPVLESFLGSPPPAWGLLGKLLGDVVAVVGLEVTEDALSVREIFVAREMRRKRVGRAMMREVEQLAAKFDRRQVVVVNAGDAAEFFRRVGFENEGDRWIRVVA